MVVGADGTSADDDGQPFFEPSLALVTGRRGEEGGVRTVRRGSPNRRVLDNTLEQILMTMTTRGAGRQGDHR
jgi:hypothetical protein